MKTQSDSKLELKKRITLAREYLNGIGHPVSQSQAYELAARFLGFQNKHSLCAAIPTVAHASMFLVTSAALPAQLVPASVSPTVGKPFVMYLEAFTCHDVGDGPDWLRLEVTQEFVDNLLARQQTCRTDGLDLVVDAQFWGGDWENAAEFRMQGTDLYVSDDSFWFRASPKHADYAVETRSMDISALLEALAPTGNPGMHGWADGILFHAGASNREFAEQLLDSEVIDINESCIDQMIA